VFKLEVARMCGCKALGIPEEERTHVRDDEGRCKPRIFDSGWPNNAAATHRSTSARSLHGAAMCDRVPFA
jgi:hypothetical protein